MNTDLHALVDILVALGLCATIGLERQLRQKSAGLRTHTFVGVGAALFMVVSKYGFDDVLGPHVTLDPSRVAAQIVSGIGFIGGGLIFVRKDLVRGLTTAATVWLAAAVGMAAGAGLLLVAAVVTVIYLVVALAFPPLVRRLPRPRSATSVLRLTYQDGRGLLRTIVQTCTSFGYHVVDLDVARTSHRSGAPDTVPEVSVLIELEGPRESGDLADALVGIDGTLDVALTSTRDEA